MTTGSVRLRAEEVVAAWDEFAECDPRVAFNAIAERVEALRAALLAGGRPKQDTTEVWM